MPFLSVIGQWLLAKAGPWILHQISRAWGVFVVGAIVVIIAMRFHSFKLDLYNEGYKAGYKQCGIDHPSTTVASGGVANYYSDKGGAIDLKAWPLIRVILLPKK